MTRFNGVGRTTTGVAPKKRLIEQEEHPVLGSLAVGGGATNPPLHQTDPRGLVPEATVMPSRAGCSGESPGGATAPTTASWATPELLWHIRAMSYQIRVVRVRVEYASPLLPPSSPQAARN